MTDLTAPLIGLTIYNAKDKYHYFPEDYIRAIRRAGGVPILLPPEETILTPLINSLDGLILTGGGDINPQLYNSDSHPSVYWINDAQDQSEQQLAQTALDMRIPILATCRGMQIINVLLGGTLHRHLPDFYGEQVAHRQSQDQASDHQITLLDGSNLAKFIGQNQFVAKSWHHQSVDKLADGFEAVGFADDGVVEAMESRHYPNLIAVQWHPEISACNDSLQQKLFDNWVKLCL